MTGKFIAIAILFFFAIGCKKDDVATKPTAAVCNDLLGGVCSGNDGTAFCTFGYKWGDRNPFSNAGPGKPGPGSGMIDVSWKFQDAGLVFDTHSQRGVTSTSFDNLINCSKQNVRTAFSAWGSVTNIRFIEKSSQETADINLLVANITQGGIAYPPIPNQACSGLVILNSTARYSCDSFYSIVLHEIGHVLGLGHVSSSNVMNPGKPFLDLQPGDIQGIQSIYGKQ